MNVVILITFARIIEAYRNAEQFEKPDNKRSVIWHILKAPQFALWLCAGYVGERWYIYAIAVAISFVIFEIALNIFRNIIGIND